MKKKRLSLVWALSMLFLGLASTAQAQADQDDGLTEIVASQNLSVRRGEEALIKDLVIHPKNISRKTKHQLDRFALIRFDSEDFGKGVRAAGFRINPLSFAEYGDKPMRFRVYGVLDGDPQDEKFTEKDYDPAAEDALADRRTANMVNRKQATVLGTFSTKVDEPVLFTNRNFLSFVRADTNGTVTLVIVRETETGFNSTFRTRKSKTPPMVVIKLEEKDQAAAEEEPAEAKDAEPAEAEAEAAAE